MNPPTSQKEVRKFIGVVNYYHDIWPRRSHVLEPLTRITPNKKKFEWTKVKNMLSKKLSGSWPAILY